MKFCHPSDILDASFRLIDKEVGQHSFSPMEWPVARRMIHACGDISLTNVIYFSPQAAAEGIRALRSGVPIVTDVTMVAAGIQTRLRSSLQIEMHCFLNDADVAAQASAQGITRSALALKRAISQFPEAIYVIGNAPTALAELTASVKRGAATPRLIVAMPVGFVGVVESKEEAMRLEVPVIAVRGRRGGSAIAAAAVNALLTLAQEESQL